MSDPEREAPVGGQNARSMTLPVPTRSTTAPLSKMPSGYYSPLRHHKRTQSLGPRQVKETLNACLEYGDEDSGQGVRINQYTIKQEIGRGSFGAVHIAVDQTGQQYAMKEFSKSRLRKQSQSNILRRPHMARGRGGPRLCQPMGHRRSASQIHSEEEKGNPLYLIREEIAIMKKLDHENIIKLYEVLDDPDGDSLYMVMEYCAKGVVMKLGLGEKVDPYPEEQCRLWFRDIILGIEYLHSQGIIHRDIKPDNLILTDLDCLKIVDFGVSEFFKKGTNMLTGKSAGSPAFLPPELCKIGHGEVDGAAVDIWSMGVTLYCLCFGYLPFNYTGVLELYEAIKNETPVIPTDNEDLKDLIHRILDKNPETRIKMSELREHPWVTCHGEDNLLSYEENTTDMLIPTEDELNSAITKNIRHVMTVVKAINKLKSLRARNAARRNAYPSAGDHPSYLPHAGPQFPRSRSLGGDDGDVRVVTHTEAHRATEGVHPHPVLCHRQRSASVAPPPRRMDSAIVLEDSEEGEELAASPDQIAENGDQKHSGRQEREGERGHAFSPLKEPIPFLSIGLGAADAKQQQEEFVVSESPTGTDELVYEEAYANEVERIKNEGKTPYSNFVVEERKIAGEVGRLE